MRLSARTMYVLNFWYLAEIANKHTWSCLDPRCLMALKQSEHIQRRFTEKRRERGEKRWATSIRGQHRRYLGSEEGRVLLY